MLAISSSVTGNTAAIEAWPLALASSVPPVIALIQTDLHLSGTEIGILSGLPTFTFGVVSLVGSLMIARFGTVATLIFVPVVFGSIHAWLKRRQASAASLPGPVTHATH